MPNDSQPLSGRSALITGGGRGIGRAIAIAFAEAGADVCVTSRTESEVRAVAEEMSRFGGRHAALSCNVADREGVEAMVKAASGELGKIDLLVNNAGGGFERTKVTESRPENWAYVVEVNLLGTYYCTHAVLPLMKAAGGGTIINVGSGMGHQPRPGNSSYNVAKAGVWMFTRCLALEVWQDNITVNELVPGPVLTDLTADIFDPAKPHPAFESEWVKQPEDVVPLAMMLATQPPNGPTGQSFSLARRPI